MRIKFSFVTLFCLVIFFTSCKEKKKIPDVSNIKIDLQIQRFENDFFNADTNNLSKHFDQLNVKYGSFFADYLFQILRLEPQPDSTLKQANSFLKEPIFRNIYTDANKEFKNIDDIKEELLLALKLTKYHFPKYNTPNKLITFVAPIQGTAVALTSNNGIAVGLQFFMGKNYSLYQDAYVAQEYPAYKTRRFEKQYIATSCITNILEDVFPNKNAGKPLAERLVEEGKRMYLLDALLPYTHDTIKTGYTQSQLKSCYNNEKVIWSFFVQQNLLFEREPSILTPYITDGPKTQELSETAPGNIGLFTGWQIVKLYMKKNKDKTLQQLMETPSMTVFNEANYAP